MALAIHLPYYATGLRADQLGEALEGLTADLLRHGAHDVRLYRSKEDAYRFRQVIVVASKADWTRIWNSEFFIDFRTTKIALYQKPLAYEMYEVISSGLAPDPETQDAPVQNEGTASAPVVGSSPGLSA
ncbi:hypothetical protein SK069_14475 [Patulibacter brassicae]|uniref:Uncharacterized protein n=1 Tax=Patulibacter brassicae TaxID=1705717 RepID=A0ABU4VLU7_9ACTN|nr:hypothetical protein [Patulibacter brassicae]MDX8152803.1 hypothetical protein [Patulibacter brassicae]